MKILALDLGGTMIKAGIVDEEGKVTQYREELSSGKLGAQMLLKSAFAVADGYSNFDRIGISTAGQVDVASGSIRFANKNIPNYTGVQVSSIFADRYAVPVALENDVNAAALGEAKFGAGSDCPNFICITYGTGIGGGIVIGGELYHGADGVAGELGHIILHPGGRLCGCGGHGCYEQYASTTALIQAVAQRDSFITNGRLLFERLDSMKDIVDAWVDEIALGLVSLIHIFNPNAVVLGGGIMEQVYISEQLRHKLYTQLMKSYRNVQLKTAELGNKAGLLGAAYLASNIGL